MNVFILNTGRVGSTTFIQACRHISNYTALHESRSGMVGEARLDYPDNHIEADNRLSWILGRLDERYGDDAFYIHLSRERQPTLESFVRRRGFGIMHAYRNGILLEPEETLAPADIAADYLETVEANIRCFLKDKSHTMTFRLEDAEEDFKRFWHWVGAEGDLAAAVAEWGVRHNASSG